MPNEARTIMTLMHSHTTASTKRILTNIFLSAAGFIGFLFVCLSSKTINAFFSVNIYQKLLIAPLGRQTRAYIRKGKFSL